MFCAMHVPLRMFVVTPFLFERSLSHIALHIPPFVGLYLLFSLVLFFRISTESSGFMMTGVKGKWGVCRACGWLPVGKVSWVFFSPWVYVRGSPLIMPALITE